MIFENSLHTVPKLAVSLVNTNQKIGYLASSFGGNSCKHNTFANTQNSRFLLLVYPAPMTS